MLDLGTTLKVIGVGASLYSAHKSSEVAKEQSRDEAAATRAAAKANAEISLYDASVATKDAAYIEQVFGWELRKHTRNVAKVVGQTKARVGKAGVAMSGSALDAVKTSISEGAIDAQLIIDEGMQKGEAARSRVERYKKLAAAGLRDAAYQATLIEKAGEDKATEARLKGAAVAIEGLYDIGADLGYF